MAAFKSIEQLNQSFVGRQLEALPNDIEINDSIFMLRDSLVPNNLSELNSGKKIIALYTPRAKTSDQRIALVWAMKSGLEISPVLAKMVGRYRTGNEETVMKEAEKKEKEEPTIGSRIDITLVSFNDNKPITGKVDTGATINSLHAENIHVRNDPLDDEHQIVDFVFEGRKYTVGLVQQQSVSSADGGVNYRPVVSFSVKYDGKVIPDVMFNLNDRSEMEDKLLIGMNLIEEIGYKIDPKKESEEPSGEDEIITEEEWAYIIGEVEKDVATLSEDSNSALDNVHVLYEYLLSQNITFADLLRHVKQHTINIVEHLE